jgi:hypothetical protein
VDKTELNKERKKERKNVRINLRITETESDGLSLVSYTDDEPVSQIVRKAIKMYVNMRKSTY